MKYKFSEQSLKNLEGVHPSLVKVVHAVMALQIMDFRVAEGLRDLKTQEEYVKKGVSKTLKSKHLIQPDGFCHAIDLYPSPIDMKAVKAGVAKEIARFALLAGCMLSVSKLQGVVLVWGGDWNGNGETMDQGFIDMPHMQIEI